MYLVRKFRHVKRLKSGHPFGNATHLCVYPLPNKPSPGALSLFCSYLPILYFYLLVTNLFAFVLHRIGVGSAGGDISPPPSPVRRFCNAPLKLTKHECTDKNKGAYILSRLNEHFDRHHPHAADFPGLKVRRKAAESRDDNRLTVAYEHGVQGSYSSSASTGQKKIGSKGKKRLENADVSTRFKLSKKERCLSAQVCLGTIYY